MSNGKWGIEGKVCLVTGATSGIGQVSATALARDGARTIVVSRNPQKCERTVKRIQEETGNRQVSYYVADLASQDEIGSLVRRFEKDHDRLDVLVNNAGGFFLGRQESPDGIEMTWALDHLNYFLLTNLLLDIIQSSSPARIINVASGAHRRGSLHFDDLQGEKGYEGWGAYAQAKLANVMFTYALARRLEGTGVTVNAMHPGFTATGFAKNNGPLARLAMSIARLFARSARKGAETVIYLAASPMVEEVSGKYFVDKKAVKSAPISYDSEAQEKLWRISEEMTNLESR
jgi:NAD(P)-dependent dehydrogenase (short-subunit alcohol dehydrogenase family)